MCRHLTNRVLIVGVTLIGYLTTHPPTMKDVTTVNTYVYYPQVIRVTDAAIHLNHTGVPANERCNEQYIIPQHDHTTDYRCVTVRDTLPGSGVNLNNNRDNNERLRR